MRLWYRVYPAGDFFFACRKAVATSEIPNRIRDEILLIANKNDAWIDERMYAIKSIAFYFKTKNRNYLRVH